MNRKIVFNIVVSGFLTALAVLLGTFAWFPLFGGSVYLVGIVIFAMPLFLPFTYMLMSGTISVLLVDVFTGWVQYSWISILAYGAALIIIWTFVKLRLALFYFVGLFIAMLVAVTIYYFLIKVTIDNAYAISTIIATSIQFTIIFPISILLYYPFKIIQKTLPN